MTVNCSGTQFELFLPLVKDVVEPSTEYQAETNKRIKAKSILMVDDEPTIRELCQDYFEVLGHNAIFAADAKHAICEYQKHWYQIDVVILDMIMPKVSGKELFKTLKDINPNIIAIVASGYTAENSVDELLKMGVQKILDKPFRLEVLKEAIEEVSR